MIYSYEVIIDNTTNRVFLDVKTSNSKGLLEYEGNKKLKLKTWLKSQTGAFGHLIEEATTPVDLDFVLSNYCPWDFKLISGDISSYTPNIPSNAKT